MEDKDIKKTILTSKTTQEKVIEWRKTDEYKLLMEAAAKAGEVFKRAIEESEEYEFRENKRTISPA